jgi:hypothetical protein
LRGQADLVLKKQQQQQQQQPMVSGRSECDFKTSLKIGLKKAK